MYKQILLASFLCLSPSHGGDFSGAAGTTGSLAVYKNDPSIVNWAISHCNLVYGTEVDDVWKTPEKAYGKAGNDVYDIVCLGNGGQITMLFPYPISDGAGSDFVVFENSFNHSFLELAFVEVSSDGQNYFRFPSTSQTAYPVGGFGYVDPTNLNGLASKYIQGYGTPFDLSLLPQSPLLDKNNIRFVRIIDIIGDGKQLDSLGNPIYDPTPTVGSGGFDLDAIGVIHQNTEQDPTLSMEQSGSTFNLAWQSNPTSQYQIESSPDLKQWTPIVTVNGKANSNITTHQVDKPDTANMFWRILRLTPSTQ